MPITRYEIRNEFTLADPDLYRAADKDDPEALLEGVAMAGLVGVLRQLGDLAEFAAEIFHDLHEEVMTTAARGHDLMIRVQQLEAEVPSIEKAFLSQTDHSSFHYNTDVDWHPNLKMDQNLVTRGDLPRFIMDSYEDCRAPPRLFLLDKYDVAGAGASLKRYTDPSFFKVETSSFGMTNIDVQRKRKNLKAKKKGSRWKNGETTPEVLTPHANLNQLFMEESIKKDVRYPARRVKLKTKPNGFSFGSKTGKSYMEDLLEIISPVDKVVHEVTLKSLIFSANDDKKSELVLEVGLVSPDRDCVVRNSDPPSPARKKILLKPSMCSTNEVSLGDKISEVPNSYPDIVTEDIAFAVNKVNCEEDIDVDREKKVDYSLTDYQSDDVASEIDNFVDAPSIMESDMDTDSEFRVKSNLTSSCLEKAHLVSDANDEQSQQTLSLSSEFHFSGNSSETNCGNNLSGKELSSFSSSDSPSTSIENPLSEYDASVEIFPSTGILESDIIDTLLYHKTTWEDIPVSQKSKSVPNDTCASTGVNTNHQSDFDHPTSSLSTSGLTPTSVHFDSEGTSEGSLRGHESEEASIPLDHEVKRANLVIDPQRSPGESDSEMQSGNNFPRFSNRDHIADESNDESVSCVATVSENLCQTADIPVSLSANNLYDQNSDQEDLNLEDVASSTLSICNVPQKRIDVSQMISMENINHNKIDGRILNVPAKSVAHTGDSSTATSDGEKLVNELDKKEPLAVSDASSCIFGVAQILDSQDHCSDGSLGNHLESQNPNSSYVQRSCDCNGADLDTREKDGVRPDVQMTETETHATEILEFCEVGLQSIEFFGDVSPQNSEAVPSSGFSLEELGKPTEISDIVEKYNSTPLADSNGEEVIGTFSSSNLTSLVKDHVQLDATDCHPYQSETSVRIMSVPSVSDKADKANVGLLVDLTKSIEESSLYDKDSGLDEHKSYKNIHFRNQGEPNLVEFVDQSLAAISDVDGVFRNQGEPNNIVWPSVSDHVPNPNFDLEAERSLAFGSTTIPSSLAQNDLGTAGIPFLQNGFGNHDTETPFSTTDYHVEEKTEFPQKQLDHKWSFDEKNLELLPMLPINHHQLLDHDEQEGDNYSAYTFSLANSLNSPSVSEFPAESNLDIDASTHPKDSFSSMLPPNQFFFETNQINLEELPPLPPLPPAQWRIGKLQHASSTSDEEKLKHKEFSFLGISPLNVHIDDTSSLHEEPNQSLKLSVPHTMSKEENVEHSSSSLEANLMMHETIDLPAKRENNQQWSTGKLQNASSTSDGEMMKPKEFSLLGISPSDACTYDTGSWHEEPNQSLKRSIPHTVSEEENVAHSSSSLDANIMMHETNDFPAEREHNQQWEIGKLQRTSSTSDGEILKHKEFSLLEISPSAAPIDDSRSVHEEPNPSLNRSVPSTISKEENVEHSCSSLEANIMMNEMIDLQAKRENDQQWSIEKLQNASSTSDGERLKHEDFYLLGICPPNAHIDDTSYLDEESNQSLKQSDPYTISNVEYSSSNLKANIMMHEVIDALEKSENNQQQQLSMSSSESDLESPAIENGVLHGSPTLKLPYQLAMASSESEFKSLAVETGVLHGSQPVKLPRPRNPLIDAVVAIDKSKLRKVAERVRPEIQKVDERDSLLEQIRTKSFNLKPALASRLSIRAPKTNLKVSAILEKANAIRQALADSDEDEDNWSDS